MEALLGHATVDAGAPQHAPPYPEALPLQKDSCLAGRFFYHLLPQLGQITATGRGTRVWRCCEVGSALLILVSLSKLAF